MIFSFCICQDYKQQKQTPPDRFRTNRPDPKTQSLERLCYRAANEHHKNNREKKMMAAVERLPKVQDKIDFLKAKGHLDLAITLMEQTSE